MRSDLYQKARTILVQRHRERYHVIVKQIEKGIHIPPHGEDPREYKILKARVAARAKTELVTQYYIEYKAICEELKQL